MSDYSKLQETERLYNLAVQYGMIPPDWDGTDPGAARSAEHKPAEHRDQGERSKRS